LGLNKSEYVVGGEYIAGIIGGIVGGIVGTMGAWLSGYWGPRKLEMEREAREEERVWGPRKKLIEEMLDNAVVEKGRSFKTLQRVTGTPDDDLRRLLVELGARGFTREDGEEAWIYKEKRPLVSQASAQQGAQALAFGAAHSLVRRIHHGIHRRSHTGSMGGDG
jgi:hypothetical protein